MTVYLASTSSIKRQATHEYFDTPAVIKELPIPQNPPQPSGLHQTTMCALRRLVALMMSVNPRSTDNNTFVSIENGIGSSLNGVLPIDFDQKNHYDFCVVFVYNDAAQELFFGISPMKFPLHTTYLEKLKDHIDHRGHFTKTYGEVVAGELERVDPKNWMEAIHGIDRKTQIKLAFEKRNHLPSAECVPLLREVARQVPDFPKEGVTFLDLMPIFSYPIFVDLLLSCVKVHLREPSTYTWVTGPEMRGTMLAMLISQYLRIPFLPLRKAGKLPPPAISSDAYDKEYGSGDVLEIPAGLVKEGHKVLVVDDILATGGTLLSVCGLLAKAGGKVETILVLDEVKGLGPPRDAYPCDLQVVL